MSKLDEILDDFDAEINVGVAWPQAKKQIKELFLELIGENREWDRTEPYDNPDMAQGHNEALDELRQKVEEL